MRWQVTEETADRWWTSFCPWFTRKKPCLESGTGTRIKKPLWVYISRRYKFGSASNAGLESRPTLLLFRFEEEPLKSLIVRLLLLTGHNVMLHFQKQQEVRKIKKYKLSSSSQTEVPLREKYRFSDLRARERLLPRFDWHTILFRNCTENGCHGD